MYIVYVNTILLDPYEVVWKIKFILNWYSCGMAQYKWKRLLEKLRIYDNSITIGWQRWLCKTLSDLQINSQYLFCIYINLPLPSYLNNTKYRFYHPMYFFQSLQFWYSSSSQFFLYTLISNIRLVRSNVIHYS